MHEHENRLQGYFRGGESKFFACIYIDLKTPNSKQEDSLPSWRNMHINTCIQPFWVLPDMWLKGECAPLVQLLSSLNSHDTLKTLISSDFES